MREYGLFRCVTSISVSIDEVEEVEGRGGLTRYRIRRYQHYIYTSEEK